MNNLHLQVHNPYFSNEKHAMSIDAGIKILQHWLYNPEYCEY